MIYALWYKFKGPDAPWLARDFLDERTRGQFISRHKKALSEWAIDGADDTRVMVDAPPPADLKVHRNP